MTFDQLWRLNLDRDGASVDSIEEAVAVGLIAAPGDERFPLEKIPQDSAQTHTFRHNSISAMWPPDGL
jgi:hypothetical protein